MGGLIGLESEHGALDFTLILESDEQILQDLLQRFISGNIF